MTKMKYFKKSILTLSLALCTAMASWALPTNFFTQTSKLASGKWVKIRVADNGIYEISYDELRAAGFENPEAVGVFGRGALLQPQQFIPDQYDPAYEQPYTDDLIAIPVMHRDGKIYFYGHGPSEIYYKSNENQRFVRKNVNTYTNYGYYMLSDISGAVVNPAEANATIAEDAEAISTCFDYFYHETDLLNYMKSGTTWWGESLLNNSLDLQWAIPGLIPDADGSLEVKVGQNFNSPTASWVTYTVDGTEAFKTNFLPYAGEDQYTWVNTQSKKFNPAAESGTLNIAAQMAGDGRSVNLDYVILAGTKNIGLAEGQAQARAFLDNTNPENVYSIANATDNLVAWEVNSSVIGDVTTLNINADGLFSGVKAGNTAVDKERHSVVMLFDTDQTQLKPEFVGEVANQNLHGSETPDLVIITTEEMYQKAEELADLHRSLEGMDVLVVKSNDLINEFSAGTPDAMAYRAFVKMLYDRNPDKLKNVLLFGDVHYDNRQITILPCEKLISFQYAPREQSLTNTFMINDYYGMMSDTYKYTTGSSSISQSVLNEIYWQGRKMQVGVGVLAFHSVDEADKQLEKIARYMTDETMGYWANNYQWTSDKGDNALHLTQMQSVRNNHTTNSGGDFIPLQAHVAAFNGSGRPVHTQFVRNLERGSLFSSYLGHGMDLWISDVFQFVDNSSLRNDRLSFMVVGGCTITEMSKGIRGCIDNMVYTKDYGFIGSLVSDRPVWADDNRRLLDNFFSSTVVVDPTARTKERISQPRTIGEVYALAKSTTTNATNKYAYHLVCDPALTIPLSTHNVAISNLTKDQDIYPGTEIEVSGMIKTRDDAKASDYNGYVVFNVMAPFETQTTYDTPALSITYQDKVLATVSVPVENGEYNGTVIIPPTVGNAVDAPVVLKACAFDPTSRLLATGNISLTCKPYDASRAVEDTEAPVVENMYANSVDAENVPNNFTVYATINDNMGMSLTGGKTVNDFAISIDGKIVDYAQRYATLDDMGKTMKIVMPFRNITNGLHNITLHASDVYGNTVKHTIQVKVGLDALTPVLTVDNKVARDNAVINIDGDAAQGRIYIHDMRGNVVYTADANGSTYTWNLKNNEGNRVPAGVYTVVCTQQNGLQTGTSQPLELIVLAN